MSSTTGASCRTSGSGPRRLSLAQSTATRTRPPMSSGRSRSSSSSGMNAYSPGSGDVPARYILTSLPSASSASFVASSEPSASPSGFSWVVTRKRLCARIASTTASRSDCFVVWGELIDQLGHVHAALDRRIVLERQLRSPLQAQLARDPRLEHGVACIEGGETAGALRLRTEHADEHTRLPQVGRSLDPGDGDEADPRVLEVAESLGENLL